MTVWGTERGGQSVIAKQVKATGIEFFSKLYSQNHLNFCYIVMELKQINKIH